MSSIGFQNRDPAGLRFLSDNNAGSETDRYAMWADARARSQERRNQRIEADYGMPDNPEKDTAYMMGDVKYGEGDASKFLQDYSASFNSSTDNNIDVDTGVDLDIGENNEFGSGSAIGNNYSVTFANQGDNNPYASLQMATAANALNDNFKERSWSNVNGVGRSGQAINQSESVTGARKMTENLYNKVGEAQQFYANDATRYRARAFGDTGATPVWKAPKPPEHDDKD